MSVIRHKYNRDQTGLPALLQTLSGGDKEKIVSTPTEIESISPYLGLQTGEK